MPWTLTQLQAIEDAIGTGQLKVEYEGKSVTYRSMDELIAARNVIRGDLVSTGVIAEPDLITRSYAAYYRG